MKENRNIVIKGENEKPILIDVYYNKNAEPKPIVIFSHGFKGFKDWGHFNIVARKFAEAGFVFVKFNFSHNGTTPDNPLEFADLEAFGNNNYSKELDDLGSVIDWVENNNIGAVGGRAPIYLLGHSRGGGISILKAKEDGRIKKIVTWSAVSDFASRLPEDDARFKKEGVVYVLNARTNQQMPLYYQFVEDFYQSKQRLDIPAAVKGMNIPQLIIHGTDDEAVPVEEAKRMKQWNPNAELLLIDGAGHTFGAKHPYPDEELPVDAQRVVEASVDFFLK
ncbi:alpha/beta hydrolase [bacterium AH-315-M05]|nr:alpha/beta hydrolase [bacterium AH-315-M05]